MCPKWSGNFDVGLLLKTIERSKQKDKGAGKVAFRQDDGTLSDALAVLNSSVVFDEAVPESVCRGLISRSLFAVAESRDLTAEALLAELSRRERAYKETPPKRYVLTTSLSSRDLGDLISHTGISDTRITFGRRLPDSFRVEHERMRRRGRGALLADLPRTTGMMGRYTFVRGSVWAKSEVEAVDKALDGLNLLRGVWNFYLNFPAAWRVSIGRRKPINKIVLGPIHSLHGPNGKLAAESGWYEPDYVGPQMSVRLDQRVEGMRTFERDVRQYLTKSRYRTDLENSLRRYGRILDSHDWNNAFVQLWGLLEHLTDTTRSDYKATSKRAMFLYPRAELPLHRQVLAHLAHHRNRAVHAGYVSEDAETLLYQLKRYVEGVLRFHLFAGVDFENRVEASAFLNLPPDLDELQKRMNLMRRAMKFHG